jgi:uncharacterized protein YebE (UPF0316 family)
MLDILAIPAAWMPAVIFLLRVGDMSLDTLRVLLVVRGRRLPAWLTGFTQSAIWVIAVTTVLSSLENLWNIVGYAAGFATGGVVGMAIDDRLAIGHGNLRIISPDRGSAVAEAIRAAGYGVTELAGRGKDGTVTILTSSVRRRDIERLRKAVLQIDPESFVTVEEVRPLHRGYWRA